MSELRCGYRVHSGYGRDDRVRLFALWPEITGRCGILRRRYGEGATGPLLCARHLARPVPGCARQRCTQDVGVEAVWTYLEFAEQEPYRHIHSFNNEMERWLERIRQPESHADDEHALVSEWRRNHTRLRPNVIDLWLVAG